MRIEPKLLGAKLPFFLIAQTEKNRPNGNSVNPRPANVKKAGSVPAKSRKCQHEHYPLVGTWSICI